MGGDGEKRNSECGTDQVHGVDQARAQGVGGRQAAPLSPAGGGGYLDICTVFKFRAADGQKKRDPRLDELVSMGLPRTWLQVVEAIGVDAFLAMWRILDADDSLHEDGRVKAFIRQYRSYLRFQRNRYIETLVALNLPDRVICETIRSQLGENVSKRRVCDLRNKK